MTTFASNMQQQQQQVPLLNINTNNNPSPLSSSNMTYANSVPLNIPITSNDRKFACGYLTCGGGVGGGLFGGGGGGAAAGANNIFDLKFTLMDIELLRNNLNTINIEVKNVIVDIKQWLFNMETNFELKVTMGDIDMDSKLFNRINLVIPKIEQSKKSIDAWYSEFQDMVSDLAESFVNYSNVAARIQASGMSESYMYGGGLPDDIVTVAKRNVTKSKFIQKQTTRLLSIDVKIRGQMQRLTFKTNELSTGILRYGSQKELNLNSLSQAFEMLGQKDSPLMRVQKHLSMLINTSPMNFNLDTAPTGLIPQVDRGYVTKLEDPNSANEEYILERLRGILNSTFYTSSTASNIDAINTYIEAVYKNSASYSEMKQLYTDITTKNIPHVLIESLAQQATNPDGIYLLAFRVQKLIAALKPYDVIYRPRLDEIAATINRTIQTLIHENMPPSQQGVVPMNIDMVQPSDDLMDVLNADMVSIDGIANVKQSASLASPLQPQPLFNENIQIEQQQQQQQQQQEEQPLSPQSTRSELSTAIPADANVLFEF